MTLRVWLHEGHDGEPGVIALGFEHLGFATWGDTRASLLESLPEKFARYAEWRRAHGLPVAGEVSGIEIAGDGAGNEIVFPPDLEPATREEVELAIALLEASRVDLMTDLESAPEGALDWDPPYRRFAPWADWRTVRAVLAHIANAETHYYTRNVGHVPQGAPVSADADWRAFLPESRRESITFLEVLARSSDLRRLQTADYGYGAEQWSVRKALRRMVSHELCHWKSVRRILGEFRAFRDVGWRPGEARPR